MSHEKLLKEICERSSEISELYSLKLPNKVLDDIEVIAEKAFTSKGVYTVLLTLLIHKSVEPQQDIRYHQSNMEGGFSGRSIDTKYITPILKQLGLPAMAESGWLTRSLEQPYPYTLDYNGKINATVKQAFLNLLDYAQKKPSKSEAMALVLIWNVRRLVEASQVDISPLPDPDRITIAQVVSKLQEHFDAEYGVRGQSKLPVAALYAIYQCLLSELGRYKNCRLSGYSSHYASDKTSSSAGDIEVFTGTQMLEALEVKYRKPIDEHMLRIAKEKIVKFNPKRYYILSYEAGVNNEPRLTEIVDEVRRVHGCHIILNGVLATIKYYLRLIERTGDFVEKYSFLVAHDDELNVFHKHKWNEIVKNWGDGS